MTDRVQALRHLANTYGRLPSVWCGIVCTALANVILSGAATLVVAQLVVVIIERRSTGTLYLVLLLSLLLAAVLLAGVGDYIFVRGTDARYKYLVGRFYRDLMRKD